MLVLLLLLQAQPSPTAAAPPPPVLSAARTPVPGGQRSLAEAARERRDKPKPEGSLSVVDSTSPSREPERVREPAAPRGKDAEAGWRARAQKLEQAVANAKAAAADAKHEAEIDWRNKSKVKKVETTRRAVEKAERSLAALQEQARRSGIPPGWLR